MTNPAGVAEGQYRLCAIYTRKSVAEGLDQAFNTLDAQRLACSHYIASQAAEGWAEHDVRYDDGGYSGGSVARPALQRLLKDIGQGRIGAVVVYKIDRLSRSLADFARLMEVFERHGVTFVSVTQHFSTTSSMGRLTLNVLLSFAQFEREITGERTRDKFAAMRAKGMRPSGGRPFGYQIVDHVLVVDKAEAAIVKRIFAIFIRLGSPVSIPETLNRAGLLNHQGRPFALSFVRRLLRNPLYCGDLMHGGEVISKAHPRIVSNRVWTSAQAIRAPHIERWCARRQPGQGMLTGLLFGPLGALLHENSFSRGKCYRYYAPPRGGLPRGSGGRYRAPLLEQTVLSVIDPHVRLRRDPHSESAGADLVRSLVARIEIDHDVTIYLKTGHAISVLKDRRLMTSRHWRDAYRIA